MSGFINADGSALVGGLTSSGTGKAFATDSNGNLNTNLLAGGNPLAPTNPAIVEMNLQTWTRNAQVCSATTTRLLASAAQNCGASVFNPATSGKNILIFSIKMGLNNNLIAGQVTLTTADPAFGTAMNCLNMKAGGPASVLVAANSLSYVNGAATQSGTVFDFFQAPAGDFREALLNNKVILLPAGSANGVALFPSIPASGYWVVTITYVEY